MLVGAGAAGSSSLSTTHHSGSTIRGGGCAPPAGRSSSLRTRLGDIDGAPVGGLTVELAQRICECSSELSGARAPQDVQRAALRLTRVAHNDTTVLRHASGLFRRRLHRDPADHAAEEGLGLLTRVLALLN